MILFINTSKIDLIQIKLIKNNKVIGQLESQEGFKQSELLLSIIDEILKRKRLKTEDLRLIAVVSGPGAFSALRLGVTTANTLAWSLGVPIIELNAAEGDSDEKLIQILKIKMQKIGFKKQKFIPVIPKYGKEPNITKAKNQLIN